MTDDTPKTEAARYDCNCDTLAHQKETEFGEVVICAMHKPTQTFAWVTRFEKRKRGHEYTTNTEVCDRD